jgi:hypothetical protein
MKVHCSPHLLPPSSLLLTCSSHEARCEGLLASLGRWKPSRAVVFHYDDQNPQREIRHRAIVGALNAASVSPMDILFAESSPVRSLRENMAVLRTALADIGDAQVVLDMSVFTRRHLLMIFRWLDDEGLWDRLCVVYSEPEDYDVSQYIPLSFGLSTLEQIPGFSACPDLSRPVHLVLFLGYEGDRALAVFEHIQPMQTTLVIADPPYWPCWAGRTERFNANLLALLGTESVFRVDAIDPDVTCAALEELLGPSNRRSAQARMICPLGTKPQALGIYSYIRGCGDPPAIVYASPWRHNHDFFSHGVGRTWILKKTP